MIRTRVTSDDLTDLAAALRYEENGAALRRDLTRNLREAVKPAITQAKTSIMAMGSAGLPHGRSLRAAIAAQVKPAVALSGRRPGVRVRVAKKGMPRGFVNAPKRTNAVKGWRHPVPPPRLGAGVEGPRRPPAWVHQVGQPGWFDTPMKAHSLLYREAVHQAMESAARRLTRKA